MIPARLLASAVLLLAACGGARNPAELTDQGYQSLRSGDHQAALESFEQAIAAYGHDTAHSGWLRAKLGAIEALTHTDAARAKDEFLKLAAANPSRVTDKEFSLIGGLLGDAGKLDEAIEVVKAGIDAHQESRQLEALVVKLGKMAETSGSAGQLDALKGLGYVGD
jgi:tetratricopeptide (TPR) repeat protein